MKIVFLVISVFFLSSCSPMLMQLDKSPSTARNMSQEFFNRGADYVQKGNRLESTKMFELAYATDPTFLRALRAVTYSYFFLADKNIDNKNLYLQKATEYAEIMIRNDHETADGHFILAMLNTKNPKHVIEHITIFINTPPNKTESYRAQTPDDIIDAYPLLAYAYGALKDYDKSLYYLKTYISNAKANKHNAQSIDDAKDLIKKIESYRSWLSETSKQTNLIPARQRENPHNNLQRDKVKEYSTSRKITSKHQSESVQEAKQPQMYIHIKENTEETQVDDELDILFNNRLEEFLAHVHLKQSL